MKSSRRLHRWCSLGLGLVLAAGGGCQTYYAGMTLPSPWYLQHPPQYFPEDPVFPLSRELAEQERIHALGIPGAPVAALPRPVATPAGAPLPPPAIVPVVPAAPAGGAVPIAPPPPPGQ